MKQSPFRRLAASALTYHAMIALIAGQVILACAAPDAIVAPVSATSGDARMATIARLEITPPSALLSAGTTFTCQVRGQTRWCWGTNTFGQLGTANNTGYLNAVQISGKPWLAVAAGNEFACGLLGEVRVYRGSPPPPPGTAFCWGTDRFQQLGTAEYAGANRPIQVAGTTVFTQIVAAAESACALDANGVTWCWGGVSAQTTSAAVPQILAGAPVFAALYAGDTKFCGLTSAGQAFCWGSNSYGELAYPVNTPTLSTPTAVAGTLRFTTVALGSRHACGLDTAGSAWCWGRDDAGQVGSSTVDAAWVPKAVNLGYTYKRIVVTDSTSCALRSDNVTLCWGTGAALGTGQKGTYRTPQPTSGGRVFTALSASKHHVCGEVAATTVGGLPTAFCWGSNAFGALGTGSYVTRSVPTAVVYSTTTLTVP